MTKSNNGAAASQRELNQLRQEAAKKDRQMEAIQKRETDLLDKYDRIKADMAVVKEQVAVRKGDDRASKVQVDDLEEQLRTKDRELRDQEYKIQSLVQQWEAECEVNFRHSKKSLAILSGFFK